VCFCSLWGLHNDVFGQRSAMVKSKKNGGDREVWRRGRAGALIPGNTRNFPHFCTCIAMPARSCFGKYSEFSMGGGCSGAMEYTPSALWRDSAEFRWKFGPHHGRRLHATRTACNNTTSYTVHTISPKHISRALSSIFAPSFAIQELQSTKKRRNDRRAPFLWRRVIAVL